VMLMMLMQMYICISIISITTSFSSRPAFISRLRNTLDCSDARYTTITVTAAYIIAWIFYDTALL